MRRVPWILAGAVALLLTACGQKGALYLPDRNAQVITTPPAPPGPAQPTPEPVTAAPTPGTPAPPKPTDKDENTQPPR